MLKNLFLFNFFGQSPEDIDQALDRVIVALGEGKFWYRQKENQKEKEYSHEARSYHHFISG